MDQKAGDQLPPASLELKRSGIPHRLFKLAGVITSLEQEAEESGQRPEQVVRSELFRLEPDHCILALAPGGAQIPLQESRKHLLQNPLTLASEDEVLRITWGSIGSVTRFGVGQHVRIPVDRQVLAEKQISICAGLANLGIVIRSQDLLSALGIAEIVDLLQLP